MQHKLKYIISKHQLDKETLAKLIGVGYPAFSKRILGLTSFKLNEMFIILDYVNSKTKNSYTLEDIFERIS